MRPDKQPKGSIARLIFRVSCGLHGCCLRRLDVASFIAERSDRVQRIPGCHTKFFLFTTHSLKVVGDTKTLSFCFSLLCDSVLSSAAGGSYSFFPTSDAGGEMLR
jgi:hypothetical protein